MTQRQQSFDQIAANIAASVDDALAGAPRPRDRRIEIAQKQIRRAMSLAYRLGLERAPPPESESPPEGNRRANVVLADNNNEAEGMPRG